MRKLARQSFSLISASVPGLILASAASANLLNLPDTPLFVDGSKTALVQMVVERDNKLFFEAYPSYEDINDDGELDIRYKPDEITYYGYFESTFCYTHRGGIFVPTSMANDKKCVTEPTTWSGDFLNYVTMTRMDVMRRSLYGGRRVVDTVDKTVLRRAFVPWENHTWGIEYTSPAVDGFNISDYSPLTQPQNGRRHLLATNNYVGKDDAPYLRIDLNATRRIWEWVDKERTQGDGSADIDLIVDVEVCRSGFEEESCSMYPNGSYKPTGLLHEYGENNRMYFSLLTGSYENNLQGGVLRQSMISFGDEEVDPLTGKYKPQSRIVQTLDAIQIPNEYIASTVLRDCGWLWNRPFNNGECKAWGNPVAEMMYEGLRYLAGEGSPTPLFQTDDGWDRDLGLSTVPWDNPYSSSQPYSQCSSAYQLVVSDPSPSFDGDHLPGSHFSGFNDSSLGNLHVGRLADFISSNEPEIPGMKFIGESNGISDGSPSPKQVTTFRTIRGQSPEAPHRQGSYYAPSVAYYGRQNDLQPAVQGTQNVANFTLALGSPIPAIDIEVSGQTMTFAPFAKTVSGCGRTFSTYYPTNAIVGFVVEEITPTNGKFRVSFEDMEQGADNDMDALARYEYRVVEGEVEFTVNSLQAAGCFVQHMGYTVSGSSADGVYLLVRDSDTQPSQDVDYRLDVPPGALPGSNWNDGQPLPLTSVRRFTPTSTPAATVLKPPLWYAAKWGGFEDSNGDGIPQKEEWDSNDDGDPDNYFKVTDPSKMVETLRNVFSAISEDSASASAVGVTGGSLYAGSRIYESSFRTGKWYGDLTSRDIDGNGKLSARIDWNVNTRLRTQIANDSREILTYKRSTGTGIPFRFPDMTTVAANALDDDQLSALSRDPITNALDMRGKERLSYIRGNEIAGFREREKPLGDIVNSTPQLVGPPAYHYPDNWGPGKPETAKPYSAFGKRYADRQRVVYVGANDGMLHAFDAGRMNSDGWTAGTGQELFAYVPTPVFEELPELASPNYKHKFYVDASPRIGDAIINGEWRTVLVGGLGRGGQGIYALDITEPGSISESTAATKVLWEFTDKDDPDLGYTYTSPLIVRMHNGRWAAVFGNGFNALEADGNSATTGKAAIFIVDLATGDLIRKMYSSMGTIAHPNGINAPTAVDLDNDNIVDIIYTGDLWGGLTKYDVRSTNPSSWSRIGDHVFTTTVIATPGYAGIGQPITAEVAVGSHPSGEGVMVYLSTGKYLEPIDQKPSSKSHAIMGIWDRNPFVDTNLADRFNEGKMLRQRITSEALTAFDTDGDGSNDTDVTIRKTTQNTIDWDFHFGWYMKLDYPQLQGEQVLTRPMLREGKIFYTTHVPGGNECNPSQSGWLMMLDAATGAMLPPTVDLNQDGAFNDNEILAGIKDLSNPFASPTIVSSNAEDVILTNSPDGSGTTSTTIDARVQNGRISWRELEP